jgi:hypothetical protein
VKLRIETTPPGAMVLRATDSVAEACVTPCTLERARGGTGVWLLRLPKHKDRQISIALDQDGTHEFTLERLKAAAPGPTPKAEPRKPIKNAVVNPYD